MTTLVTGATGRVGSRFVPRLLARGHHIRVLARDPQKAEPLRERGAEIVNGDLREPDSLAAALDGVDAVVHLAASFRGVSPEETAAVNRDATLALAQAALDHGTTRFILASTNLVYGPGRGRPAREVDEPAPAMPYPQTKAAAEHALGEMPGLDLRILRFAFVYGDGDPHLAESLNWARDWAAHKRLHMVHHADVAQALIRALYSDGVDGEIFNVADDAPVTAAELLELNGEPLADDAATRPLEDPWEGIVDNSKSRVLLGVRPIYPSVYTARDAGAL
jgi:nucleoside-diphosphate-sugar epimerase